MRRAIVVVATVLVLAVLAVWLGPRTQRSWQLSRSRSRWEASGVSDYTLTIGTGCFGGCTNGHPLTITVRDGKPVRIVTQPPSRQQNWAPKTIDALFERIDELRGSDRYAVTYDEKYGYPVRGAFDPSRSSTDDEWGFTVTSFTLATPSGA